MLRQIWGGPNAFGRVWTICTLMPSAPATQRWACWSSERRSVDCSSGGRTIHLWMWPVVLFQPMSELLHVIAPTTWGRTPTNSIIGRVTYRICRSVSRVKNLCRCRYQMLPVDTLVVWVVLKVVGSGRLQRFRKVCPLLWSTPDCEDPERFENYI